MSQILVVEPRPILRQAISLALSRDHEVRVATVLSDSEAAELSKYDLVIIDAAALRDTSYGSRPVPTVPVWKVPTIWIDDGGDSRTLARDKGVVLNTPIQKDALQAVVATCLGMTSTKQNGALNITVAEPNTENHEATAAASQGPHVIELVDVVGEPPQRRRRKSKR